MKRTCIIIATLVAAVLLAGSAWAATDTLTIVHVNDSHSHLTPHGPKDAFGVGTRGGIARAASVIGQIQATEENVLFLHAGDIFIGDFMFNKYFGVTELQILAQLGCDAVTIGNHEFDLTPDGLKLALSSAGFPIPGFEVLSANLDMTADPELDYFVEPSVIKDVNGLKVGLFGLTTEETNAFSMPSPVVITSCVDGAVAAVTALQGQCDLIVGLTHLGFEVDQLIAANVPGIDLIVGGHSHDLVTDPVAVTNPLGGTTWIVQAGEFYEYVGKTTVVCGAKGIETIDYQIIPIDSSVPEEPTVAAIVGGLIADLESDPRYGPAYSDVIAEAEVDVPRELIDGYKDTPMGNLVTDAFRQATGTELALTVWGFISQRLSAGPLTGSDIFQSVPYGYDTISGHGFRVATFELTGLELIMGLEYTTEQAKMIHDLYIQVSGMSFGYDSSKPMGEKVKWVLVDGQPIDPAATYTVTTNSGLAGFLSLAGLTPHNLQDAGCTEYEAVRDYIVGHSPVNYGYEGRIVDAAETPATASLQLIHNAADPAAETVDIYLNRVLLLDDFAFRSATPFIDALAGENLNIAVAPSTSAGPDDAVADFNITLTPNGRHVAMASGVLEPSRFAANPDGRDTAFDLFIKDGIHDHAFFGLAKFIACHGATDAPAVNISTRHRWCRRRLIRDLDYGEFSRYCWLRADDHLLTVASEADHSVLGIFRADLRPLRDHPGVLFLSGFVNPQANQDGPALGLFLALPDGQVMELPRLNWPWAMSKEVVTDPETLPVRFCLEQNYPNPFNPATTIAYSLPEDCHVRLEIYNLLGQRVATLVEGWETAGQRSVRWDASGLASGVYVCRLAAGDYAQTRKMTLLK
jgi:5'-nucleotidase/UDP-sugar diphosphatase